ncbi:MULTISPECIES: ABC transporter ATP-binding protein [unclassified Paenibacillus]|uniref:ABC transporter ATP-binding protein n=1 Tax=unclassified Paenibacillus TaxID=185978 RepID=UPI0003FE24F5|nr:MULTISPECIES: ABC transporter ATP-binding protein [unclassified Paenibacillus]KGP82539.1 ABC transporter ATP-binding protein [Paenibacillus sp. MAEPY2]KGP89169.1 ABC transporter ATP-binding protein [Paenibacillus sp. MAEPY1]
MAQEQADPVLSVQHLKKKIGRKWIIKDVTFDVKPGEIFGFLGPNGAGKTTTIRMLVDLIKPTEGKIQVCGYDVNRDPERALKYVGSIVENPEVYTYLTGWENLEHFARMQPGVDNDRIQEVVDIVRLDQRIHDKVRTYSLGMRQRLGIAQALLGRPRLLILDEPTNGLDPKGIKELRIFIKQLASEGMAVFVSSHLLSEIQLLCDRVAIISAGRVLTVGGVNELIEDHSKLAIWHITPLEAGKKMLLEAGISLVDRPADVMDDTIVAGLGSNAVVAEMHEDRIPALVQQMVQAGIQVEGVQRIQPTLEQLFLKMTEGESIE